MAKANRKSGGTRWTRSKEKEQYWQHRIDAWQASELSVRAYCQEYGVVETSFYAWRRELAIRNREASVSVDSDTAAPTPAKVKDQRGRSIPLRLRDTPSSLECGAVADKVASMDNPFVKLNLVSTEGTESAMVTEVPLAAIEIDIVTPGGFRISLSKPTDICLLRTIVRELEDRKC